MLEEANDEIQNLKDALNIANINLNLKAQEIDVIKKERKELQQQRDSIQVYCNSLQAEKSKAIIRYLEAIHDSKNIKKQKDEACKEIEQLKEFLGTQIPTNPYDMRFNYMQELDMIQKSNTEIVNVDVSSLLSTDGDIGIILDDGQNDDQNTHHGNYFTVVSIRKDSIFYNKLESGDVILHINNLDCTNVSKNQVIDEIRSKIDCSIIVRRKRSDKCFIYTAEIELHENRNHGLLFEDGIFISKIADGSPASSDKIISVGDRILSINNHTLESLKNLNDILNYLDSSGVDTLTIVGMKQISPNSQNHSTTGTQTESYYSRLMGIEQYTDDSYQNSSASYVSNANSSSTKFSLFSEMMSKIRGMKTTIKSNDTEEAIAVLDKVLKDGPSNIPTKDNGVIKRTKKKYKDNSKETTKSMGTWPRATFIEHDNNTGTIVYNKKKERPKLFEFTESFQAKQTARPVDDYYETKTSKTMTYPCDHPINKHSHTPASVQYPFPKVSPKGITNRHSTALGLSTLPRLQKTADLNFNHHNNRYSLNLSENCNSFCSNKKTALPVLEQPVPPNLKNILGFNQPNSQPSIESFRGSISPPPLDFTSKIPTKMPINFLNQYQHKIQANNNSNIPSDNESLPNECLNLSDFINYNLNYNRAVSPKSTSVFSQFPLNYSSQQGRLSSSPTVSGALTETNYNTNYNEKTLLETFPVNYHSHGASIDYPELNRLILGKESKDISVK